MEPSSSSTSGSSSATIRSNTQTQQQQQQYSIPGSRGTAQASRAPSIHSLRTTRRSGGGHSRRPSMDIGSIDEHSTSLSTSPSPITYFPSPTFYSATPSPSGGHPLSSSRTTTLKGTSPTQGSIMPHSSSSRRASTSASSSEVDIHNMAGGGNDRTPRLGPQHLEPGTASPKTRRSSTLGSVPMTAGFAEGRRNVSHRTSSTPVTGGSGTPHLPPLEGLGLGNPVEHRRIRKDSALASPRRISTSVQSSRIPSNASGSNINQAHMDPKTSIPPSSFLIPNSLPTNEAYYSQPPTATTPRFRASHLHTHSHSAQYGSTSLHPTPNLGSHHRRLSANSLLLSTPVPAIPPSPAKSVMRKLRKTASSVGISMFGGADNYDQDVPVGEEDEEEGTEDDEGRRQNGTRVWYSSYVTIDWIHDAIKESSRVRRLRHNAKRSTSGSVRNTWDRFQGWLVVTIIGIASAIIAFMIIRAEMVLFDLKEGFCSTSWGTAKRFCCAPHHRGPTGPGGDEGHCGDWVEWGEFWRPHDQAGPRGEWAFGWAELATYGTVALGLATLASCLTIYLSSSADHTTSKDSTFLVPSPLTSSHELPKSKNSERQPLLQSSPIISTFTSPRLHLQEPPRKTMYYAAGSGIPEIKTILSGFVIHGYLGGWTLLTKSVGLALSVGSGLSLGKEGPLVHISSCVGNIVSRAFTKFECNEAKRREILSAACAAGVAVAFGAPIGGVLFSLEEVSYYFPPKVMWRSFWCAAVAAITLKGLNPFGNGSLVLFAVTYTKQYHLWEFAIFILLGVFGGVYGAVFSRLNILWSKHVRGGTWLGRHPIIEVLMVTALTTALSFLNPYCRMGGTELVASLFAECKPNSADSLCVDHPSEMAGVIYDIGMTLIIKGCLTIITFGIKLPAGIFIPSLVVGACFGRIVGVSLEYAERMYPELDVFEVCKDTTCVVPGLYAMLGAAATLAGVTRTTISLVVIVLELTNSLNYVVPVMLCVLIAKTTADALEKKGIYDLVIDLNQLPYLDSKHEYLWGGRRVSEIAESDIPVLRADKTHTVRSLTGRLLELVRMGMGDTGFPVLVKEGERRDGEKIFRVVGFLGMNELEHALSELADEPDSILNLMPEDRQNQPRSSVLSIFSFAESFDARHNPYDISRYIDRAPITVQIHSPLELVQQLFVKLGARQLLVVDGRGIFKGIITKKGWLNFLNELEEGGH